VDYTVCVTDKKFQIYFEILSGMVYKMAVYYKANCYVKLKSYKIAIIIRISHQRSIIVLMLH